VIADEQMVVSITASDYAKRTPLTTYRQQRRGGRGVQGMNMKEGDYIEHLHVCSTHDYLLFFTNQGKVYRLKVSELPEGSRASRGRALVNVLPLKDKERVTAVIPTRDFSEGKFLVFGTAQGMVKKTPFKDYDTPIRADGIIAINIRKGDELVRVRMTSGKDDIILVSKSGHAARFSEKQARPMGRATAGVKGMNVSDKGNRVLSLDVVDHTDTKGDLLVVTENGYGKRTLLAEYPVKGRGAKGMLTARLTAKKGGLAGARVVREGQELIFISETGMVQRNAVDGISRMGRATQGVRVMNLKKGDLVSAVALVVESDNGNGNGAAAKDPSLEDEAPSAATVADEAAAVEAAGNGEPTVTKAPRRRSSGSKAPAKSPAKPKPASRKRTSRGSAPAAKPKAAKPKVKPKHTATARQRAEAERKKKGN
jgi:DNA gyrase subunit A